MYYQLCKVVLADLYSIDIELKKYLQSVKNWYFNKILTSEITFD